MGLKRLDGKSLIIFAGKGGVGKTTCSAAIALHYAQAGRRTLLVTVDPAMRLEDSLGVPLDSRETLIRPNLWASMLDPEEIIRDKLAQYADGARIMEHPMFRYVTNYLPGLNELMAIGKLNELRRESDYDVVVVVRGPALDMVTRRRDRVFGIWVNRTSVAFEDAPSYYATLSARPVDEIAPETPLLRHQIGFANIRLRPADEDQTDQLIEEFRSALIRSKIGRGLYLEDSGAVTMLTPALFSTRIPLPAHIATGSYSARILVFTGGTLVATQRENFWVAKSGFEAQVFNWAERRPFLYGVGAVAIALFAGWFAGVIFRRD
jgi:uncharacterized protein (TIGR02186 family)